MLQERLGLMLEKTSSKVTMGYRKPIVTARWPFLSVSGLATYDKSLKEEAHERAKNDVRIIGILIALQSKAPADSVHGFLAEVSETEPAQQVNAGGRSDTFVVHNLEVRPVDEGIGLKVSQVGNDVDARSQRTYYISPNGEFLLEYPREGLLGVVDRYPISQSLREREGIIAGRHNTLKRDVTRFVSTQAIITPLPPIQ